jgi:DNA-binding SARP family transcriptional activator
MRTSARLSLMGGFDCRAGARQVVLPRTSQRLLAFLALKERPVLRTYASATLWLDSPEERACANLRTALWHLRRSGRDLVWVTNGQIALHRSLTVDFYDLRTVAHEVLRGEDATVADEALSEVLSDLVDARTLLPDWYDDWVTEERERLEELRVRALEALCERFVARGFYSSAVIAGLAAVATDPLRESAQRALIKLHLAEGNLGAAALRYEAFSKALGTELGLAPSGQMVALMSEVFGEERQLAGVPGRSSG